MASSVALFSCALILVGKSKLRFISLYSRLHFYLAASSFPFELRTDLSLDDTHADRDLADPGIARVLSAAVSRSLRGRCSWQKLDHDKAIRLMGLRTTEGQLFFEGMYEPLGQNLFKDHFRRVAVVFASKNLLRSSSSSCFVHFGRSVLLKRFLSIVIVMLVWICDKLC